jgi:uncharacterized protein (DUF2132 family)
MTVKNSSDPLHGKTLEAILIYLEEYYGWEQMALNVRINCWARKKVEDLYIRVLEKNGNRI